MNESIVKPKINCPSGTKKEFTGWVRCAQCQQMIYERDLEQAWNCCPQCHYHHPLGATQRIDLLTDPNSFCELFTDLISCDPLDFVDSEPYTDRLTRARQQSGRQEGVIVGMCCMGGRRIALGVMDFSFMGGSMGSVVGEKITLLIEYATQHTLPLVIVSVSGGARMQESIFSLMQMAKCSGALKRYQGRGVPYISIVTHPTTGGVTASFASLGDVIIGEPGALFCFAGPRVVEQVTKEKLPPGAQKTEFLQQHGMIDCVVPRAFLKQKIVDIVNLCVP